MIKLLVSELRAKDLVSPRYDSRKIVPGAQHGAFKQDPKWTVEGSACTVKKLLSEVKVIGLCEINVPVWILMIESLDSPVWRKTSKVDDLSESRSCVWICDLSDTIKITREMWGLYGILVAIAYMTNDMMDAVEGEDSKGDFKHIKRFDGRKNGQSVEEFLSRIDALARVRKWTEDERAAQLLDLTTDRPFQLLSNVPRQDGSSHYDRLVIELRNAYGLTMDRAITSLVTRVLSRDESVYDFASDLRNFVLVCLPGLSEQDRSRVAAIHYWRGLHQSEAIRHLFGNWKGGERSLERALELTLDAAEPAEGHAYVGGAHYPRRQSPPFKNKTMHNQIKKDRNPNSRKCYRCGGFGHEARNCATEQSKKSVCENLIISVFDGKNCLLDTGCSLTMCCIGSVSDRDELVPIHFVVNGFNGLTTCTKAIQLLSVYGIELSTVPVFEQRLCVDGVIVDYILGLDFIRKVGGITVLCENKSLKWSPLAYGFHALVREQLSVGIQTDESISEYGHESETSEVKGYALTAKIVMNDMILRRYKSLEEPYEQHWEVEWLWIEKSPPAPSWSPANYGLSKHPESAQIGFKQECQLWIDNEFLVPVDREDVKMTVPLMCVEQQHKPSTPIRPVGDYKAKLNRHIISQPHEDLDFPVSANFMLLVWRAIGIPLSELVLVDISKAYMRVRVREELTYYQCFVLPWTEQKFYRLTRLGFGVNIAVKTLRVILNYILDEEKIDRAIIAPFVDDMPCPKEQVAKLREIVRKNGFDIKEPEEMDRAKALGLRITPQGNWMRRSTFPDLESNITRRTIHQWCGKITAHYPSCGWLRPACSQLKRLTTMPLNGKSPTWDEPVQQCIVQAVHKFQQEIQKRGDSVGGIWSFNKDHDWELFTDASKYAWGAVVRIGGVIVSDATWLRKVTDIQPINVAELEGVVKGIAFVYQMMKALGKKNLRLTVFCDNANAVSWLNRKEARHWSTVTGVNAAVVDSKLSTLQSVSEAAKISLTIKQVPSEANISDALSRIPLYMLPPKDQILAETPESADCMVIRIPRQLESIQRNSDGLIELQPTDAKVEYLMKTLHEHEGAHALYERMRRIVNVPRLRALCREYVSKCKDCQLSKVSANAEARAAPVLKNMDGSDFLQSGDTPWRVVHMDVHGPYQTDRLSPTNFVITLVDSCTGYLVAKCTRSSPTSHQLISHFRRVLNVFNACPETLLSDNGSIFVSAEILAYMSSVHCRVDRSPVGASWCNGKVERKHRILHEHLLANAVDKDYLTFEAIVQRVVQNANTAHSTRQGCSSHELIFGYPAWIHTHIPLQLRPNRPNTDSSAREGERASSATNTVIDITGLPQKGELWLLRRAAIGERNLQKLSRPYRPVRIKSQVSTKVYRVVLTRGAEKVVHLRHLKRVNEEIEKSLSPDELPPVVV